MLNSDQIREVLKRGEEWVQSTRKSLDLGQEEVTSPVTIEGGEGEDENVRSL